MNWKDMKEIFMCKIYNVLKKKNCSPPQVRSKGIYVEGLYKNTAEEVKHLEFINAENTSVSDQLIEDNSYQF